MIELREINQDITLGLLDLKAYSANEGTNVKREIERAGTRFLLSQLTKNPEIELSYTAQNKPYLNNSNTHISISHSHDKLAIICNKRENTGVDIELIRDKVKNVQHKFLSERELVLSGGDPETLITFWAAKEALYKVYGLKEVEFIKNLLLYNHTATTLEGQIKLEGLDKRYKLLHEKIGEYKLVYVLNEIR